MNYNKMKVNLPLTLKKDDEVCNGSGFSDTFSSSNGTPKQINFVKDNISKNLFQICHWRYKED